MKIAFVWQGITGRYGHWQDGLYYAMKELEKYFEITYHEPSDEIDKDAIVLYWEAPCTINGQDAHNYKRIMGLPNKKALLFAGGQVNKDWVSGFDHVFVESKINKDEFDALGVPNSTAFGVNADMFKPEKRNKNWEGIHPATCASWKRQQLGARAFGKGMLLCGRFQETDPLPFKESQEYGALVLPEQTYEVLVGLYNQSHALIQTAEYWGGGQRATLEALACNIPVICMTDSPKNREYVEESGYGLVVEPDPARIKEALEEIKTWEPSTKGRDYVLSKWTHYHYADNIKQWLLSIQS